MSKINFRLFADQIFGFISKPFNEYLTPQLIKENFSKQFKEGNLILNNISLNNEKKFYINNQKEFIITYFSCSNLNLIIPDETTNFSLNISNLNIDILLNSLNEEDILNIVINHTKYFFDNFKQYIIDIVEKNNKSPSMLDGLLQNLLNRLFIGLNISINNVNINFLFENIKFNLNIKLISYNENDCFKLENINLKMIENNKQLHIIKDFGMDLKFKLKNNDEDFNLLEINFNDFELILEKIVSTNLINIFNEINYNHYKLLEYKMKKLIHFYKPKDKKDYKNLWKWAINVVLKLKKYSIKNQINIFKLNFFDEKEIINKSNFDNYFLINKLILLLLNKKNIENILIDNKKKKIVNPFNFFFGGAKKNEDKNSLTSEEKETFDNLFLIDNLNNFINNKIENQNKNNLVIFDKIKEFFKNIEIKIKFPKIILKLINNEQFIDFILENCILNYEIKNNEKNGKIFIKDIISINNSIFLESIKENNIEIIINENFNINFNFGLLCLNNNIFSFLFEYILSIINEKFKKVFYEKKFELKIEDIEILKKFKNKIKFSNYPSFSIIFDNDEKILFHLNDIHYDNNIIKFHSQIIDNKINILDYIFIFENKDKKLKCILNEELTLNLTQNIIKIFLTNYYSFLKIKREKNLLEENIYTNFYFDFDSNLLNFNILNFNKLDIDFQIKNFKILLDESKIKSSLIINNFILNYNSNTFNLDLNSIIFETHKNSSILLCILHSFSPDYNIPEKTKIFIDENTLNNAITSLKKINSNEKFIESFNNIFQIFKININKIEINFKEDLINTYLFCNNIIFEKTKNNIIEGFINTSGLYINNENLIEKVFNFKEKILINIFFEDNHVEFLINNPEIKLNLPIIFQLKKSFLFIIEEIDLEEVILKFCLTINNIKINFNNFFLSFEKIFLKNYNEFFTDKLFLTLDKLQLNNNNLPILLDEMIKITYYFKSRYENICYFDFSNLIINITQKDIFYMILGLDKDSQIVLEKIYNENNKNNLTFCFFKIKDDIFLNHLKFKDTFYKIELFIPKVKIQLNLENNEKLSEFNINNLKFYSTFIDKANIVSEVMNNNENNNNNNIKFDLILQDINLKYFDVYSKEITVISDNKNNLSIKNSTETDNQNTSQITLNYEKNFYNILINSLTIFIRFDTFLSLYLYFKNSIPFNLILNRFKHNKKKLQFTIKFFESKFIIQTNFDNSENIITDINNSVFMFQSVNDLTFPYGNLCIQCDSMKSQLIYKGNRRNLFYTKNYFLFSNISINKTEIKFNIMFGEFIINLAYSDILSFVKTFQLNKFFYSQEKRLEDKTLLKEYYIEINSDNSSKSLDKLIKNPKDKKNNKNILKNIIKGEFSLTKIDITLIENSTETYYPFMNLILNHINIILENQDKLEASLEILLNSYNYISCVWEPTIENFSINFKYIKAYSQALINHKIFINSEEILINLSDMNISFVLVALNNWLSQLIKEEKKYNDFISNPITNNSIIEYTKNENEIKITNNKVINITGEKLKIIYYNQEFFLNPSDSIYLEYKNDDNSSDFHMKQIKIQLLENEKEFSFSIEKLGNRKFELNNNNKYMLILENTLSPERYIDINIYSPIIFKNSTTEKFILIFINENKKSIIDLEPFTKSGIPINLYDDKVEFYFTLPNINENKNNIKKFLINEIKNFSESVIPKNIIFNKKIFKLILRKNISNLKEIKITFEYTIINCLPFDLYLMHKNNTYIIKQFTQFYLDFMLNNDEFYFLIKIGGKLYNSKKKKYFEKTYKKNGNFIKFIEEGHNTFFKLSMINYKKHNNIENILIIYAEHFIKNECGIDNIIISSKNKESSLCFNINNYLFLISSKIDLKNSFIQLSYNNFFESKKINMKDLISSASLNYKFVLKSKYKNYDENLELIIKSHYENVKISNNPYFNEKILTEIYSIYPYCRITNLLENFIFYISDNSEIHNYFIIKPFEKINFNYFFKGKNIKIRIGISNLGNNAPTEWSMPFIMNDFGFYTFYLNEIFINIEFKHDSKTDILETYVTQSSLKNCQVVIKNKSSEGMMIYQEKFEKYMQIIENNDEQILKIFDPLNSHFSIEMGTTAFDLDLKSLKNENSSIPINKNIILLYEKNIFKIHLTLYKISIYEKLSNITKEINYCVNLKNLGVSIIGDNEQKDKKLRKYERYEILYLHLGNNELILNQKVTKGLLRKNNIQFRLIIENINIFNQFSDYGKFYCFFQNDVRQFLTLYTEISNFEKDNISIINNFILNISKIIVNIEPNFVMLLITFLTNISYRIKTIKKNNHSNEILSTNIFKGKEELIELYVKSSKYYFGNNINLPYLDLTFEISSTGLEKLFKEYLKFSNFLNWIINGLSNKQHTIRLVNSNIKYFAGSSYELMEKIFYQYKNNLIREITGMGIKGFFLGIAKIFSSNNLEEKIIKNVKYQRMFFGKYKYFKKYDKEESKAFNIISKKFSYFGDFCYTGLIQGKNFYYLFTTVSLIILDAKITQIFSDINYIFIKEINIKDNIIYIKYNQDLDGNSESFIKCEDNNTAGKVGKFFKEQIIKHSDEIYWDNN